MCRDWMSFTYRTCAGWIGKICWVSEIHGFLWSWSGWMWSMKFFDHIRGVFKICFHDPFIFFQWKSFPMNKVFNFSSSFFWGQNFFNLLFFYSIYKIRGRRSSCFLWWECSFVIRMEKTFIEHVMDSTLLQFISFIMVSFSFLSYVALACSLVCILTIGYILWFFWVLWTLLLLNSNPRRFPSATTGRDDTCWLIYAYAYSILDSLVFRPILSYRTCTSYYSLIPSCSMEFYAYASPSISRQLHVL